MLHPIFATVLGHPELIADHASNYALLVRQEMGQAGRALLVRAIAGILAGASGLLALGLGGVAIMLGAMHGAFHWILVIVPATALLIAMIAGFLAARMPSHLGFTELKAQMDADARVLHIVRNRHES